MKKLVMILLVLCLAAVAVIGTLDARTGLPVPAAASAVPAAETDSTPSAGQNNYVIAGDEYRDRGRGRTGIRKTGLSGHVRAARQGGQGPQDRR